ncbi:hypothetical protein GJAV_G00083530 [Gymnothorax javanicus]|nr:hypothetical protein GJAV_G00083530 [Gymnothorax javanicus]
MVSNVLVCAVFLVVEIHVVAKTEEDYCDLSGKWLEYLKMTRDIWKMGFHRDMVTALELGPRSPEKLHALLMQRLPSGVYVDPYQLASLRQDRGLQVLLDTEVDLEAPAYSSSGLSMFVYPTRNQRHPHEFLAVVPIHGRYHRPSGCGWEKIELEPPQLFLRADDCAIPVSIAPKVVIDAPCNGYNRSMCKWTEIKLLQSRNRGISLWSYQLVTSRCWYLFVQGPWR